MYSISAIIDYLDRYWNKYPMEKEHDPTLKEINLFLEHGGHYYLSERLFILYVIKEDHIDIVMYWCDLTNITRKEFSREMRNHRNFIGEFSLPVYSQGIKSMFNRKYLGSFESDGRWRWC